MKTRFMIRLLVLGGVCTTALTACDSRELLAPGLKPSGSARAGLTEPVSLGSQVLPPPPNTGGTPGPSISLGSVPANTWVVFEVSGSVSGEWNPECNERPPAWPCGNGALAQNYTGGADPWAPVTITYTYDQFGTHTGRILLRGTGEGAAVGLYSNDFPSTLDGFLKVNTLTSWDPNFGVMIPSYIKLSGGYTVSATMVPSPFQVTETAPDASGTITYTAEPLYGLKFINPPLSGYLPAGDLVWKFFPGDSLSDEPDFSWPGEYIYECERKTVCNFRPPGPGRVQVSAYVEMQTAYVRSKPESPQCNSISADVRLSSTGTGSVCGGQDPKIELSCDKPTPNRAETITCTARPLPSSAVLTELTWAFVDSAGHTIPGPTGPDTWRGEMAVSGLMKVSGKANGVPSSDSLQVGVRARRWQRLRLDPAERGHGDLPYPPTNAGDLAHTRADTLPASNIPAHEITDGPNKGWAFMDSIPQVPVTTHLSRAWNSSDAWYQMQHYGVAGLDINGNTAYYCTQSQLGTVLTLARKHEGAGLQQTNSHVDVMLQYVRNHNQHEEVERQVVYVLDLGGIRTLGDWFRDDVWKAFVVNALMNDPRQGHTNQTTSGVVPPAYFPCQLRY
ncbi:MAG TPA: hypothetical protein VFJ16_20700 [Longimicrobium sp.]|nr:hypothetical protein [Longimicrobium sp.]